MDLDVYFNEWAFLAIADPEVFERRRQQCISEFLGGSGKHRQRLETLQSRIDTQRNLANTPQEALVAISLLMFKSLCTLADEMESLSVDLKNLKPLPPGESSAVVPTAFSQHPCD